MKVVREHSNFRIGWDLLILIFILVSCALIPFQIAFRHAAYKLGTEIIYFIDLFFLIDILLNFRRRTGELYSNRPEFSIPSEKLVLTTNPALVIWMVIVVV